MNILVCYKVLPDFEQLLASDWADFALDADLSYAKRVLNCFDESALEIALQLRDASEEEMRCTAVTLGAAPPPFLRKTLFAAGFDELHLLECAGAELCPAFTAQTMADFAAKGNYDLILTGAQAGYGDSGIVPILLAQHLDLPVITLAQELSLCTQGLDILRETDGASERLTVRLPAVVTIGNSPVCALRAATLQAQLAAAKRELLRHPVAAPQRKTPVLSAVDTARTCRFVAPEDLPSLLRGGEEV